MSPPGAGDPGAPLGVFDSGVGGLTVLEALRRRLPGEGTVYLGDTARLPYGPKSPETVLRYAREAAAFLLERGVKMLVVACNTASARALPSLAEGLPVPVVGVIAPGARAAVEATRGGGIGVLGTRGTVESGAYQEAIRRLLPGTSVTGIACSLFVALVEEGWTEGEVAEGAVRRYLAGLPEAGVDTLVLGCTHYPHLRPLLQRVAGPDVTLVEPARATAEEVAGRLARSGLAAVGGGPPERRFYVTDDAARFRQLAGRWLEEEVRHLEQVTLPPIAGARSRTDSPARR